MSTTVVLTFSIPIEAEEELTGFFLQNSELEGVEETDTGLIKIFIPKTDWTPELEAKLRSMLVEHRGAVLESVTDLEERDWNAEWEAGIEPQRVTDDLTISPSWKLEKARDEKSKHLIVIDPKMSFGTGHHETTRLCLRALESIDVKGKRVLDIGTGSGVLAIYALQRGAEAAVAIDTDHWSIENAIENRGLNDLTEKQLEIRQGDLSLTVSVSESFEIIFANIHRNILMESAMAIKSHAGRGATIILSGLLHYDQIEVTQRYTGIGFNLLDSLRENDWIALVFSA